MPNRKEMEKLAGQSSVGKNAPAAPAAGPAAPLRPACWDALLRDACADASQPDPSIRTQRLSQITQHLLRVTCCGSPAAGHLRQVQSDFRPCCTWPKRP
ncbi:hypothetical protein BKD09_19115 [Bradyrhizobium japonicum]|uniref:Uncharacterized protein n=1 Tax=Bradyrhizobium japonicum TaxID=375 RepID=A0A1L3FAY2_BRAJP|nr:hypothetical protein BKD09_19115 [Bradyrhizobium japonicum]